MLQQQIQKPPAWEHSKISPSANRGNHTLPFPGICQAHQTVQVPWENVRRGDGKGSIIRKGLYS